MQYLLVVVFLGQVRWSRRLVEKITKVVVPVWGANAIIDVK